MVEIEKSFPEDYAKWSSMQFKKTQKPKIKKTKQPAEQKNPPFVFEDPRGGWEGEGGGSCSADEGQVFFKCKPVEENSSSKLLIGSSRSSKITHVGHEKNFKALRGSVCIEYNGSSKLQGIQRPQDQRRPARGQA